MDLKHRRSEFLKTKIKDTPMNWHIWKRGYGAGLSKINVVMDIIKNGKHPNLCTIEEYRNWLIKKVENAL